jgi:hypothetical protein
VVALLASRCWDPWALVFEQMSDLIVELPKHSREIEGKLSGLKDHIYASRFEMKQVIERVAKVMEPKKGEESSPAGQEDSPSPDSGKISKLPANSPFNLSSEEHPIFVRVLDTQIGIFHQFLTGIGPLVYPLSKVVMVTVLLIFMLLRREDLRNRLIHVLSRGRLQGTLQAINDATSRVGRYLLIQSLINGGYGVVVAISLLSGCFEAGLSREFSPRPSIPSPIGPWLRKRILLVATSDGWHAPPGPLCSSPGETLHEFSPRALALRACRSFILRNLCRRGILDWLWGPIGLILATPLTVCLVSPGSTFPTSAISMSSSAKEPLSGEKYYQATRRAPGDATALMEDASAGNRAKSMTASCCQRSSSPTTRLAPET